jgi:hypothetical protein
MIARTPPEPGGTGDALSSITAYGSMPRSRAMAISASQNTAEPAHPHPAVGCEHAAQPRPNPVAEHTHAARSGEDLMPVPREPPQPGGRRDGHPVTADLVDAVYLLAFLGEEQRPAASGARVDC